MFGPFERLVAFRYLRARRQEGFISVIAAFSLLGIALGVATLIIVMSVMNGFRQELLGRILGFNGHLGVYATQGPLADFDAIAERVRGIEGVVSVTPIVEGQVMATTPDGRATGALVRGVRPEDVRARALIAGNIKAGSLDDFQGEDAILVGTRFATRMNLLIGDRISLVSPQGQATAFGTVPRIRSYRVVALYEAGMYEYDNSFVFLPLPAAQLYFRSGAGVTQLELFVRDPDRVDQVRRALFALSPRPPIRVVDWQQANSAFFNAIQVERNVMFLILSLIILVAAFNIISSLIMLVKDKGRDIAILRTMGATRGAVMRIFLMCGAFVGVFGTIAGTILGLVFCRNIESIRQLIERLTGADLFNPTIRFLSQLPAVVDPWEVAQVVGMALALSFFATIYPSWRAARLDPVEALRYE